MTLPEPYYQDDAVTLFNGDCREILPLLGQCADALVTDPPYGTELLGGGYGRRQLADPKGKSGHVIAGDKDLTVWRESVPFIHAALPKDAWLFSFCAPRKRRETEDAILACGGVLVGEIVWDKGAPGLGYTIRYSHETAIVSSFGKPKPHASPLLSVMRGDISQRAMNGRHPHEKPVHVLGAMVAFAVPESGTVLDTFCGSGSTLVAAKEVGRRAIGIELDRGHCEATVERLRQGVLFAPRAAPEPEQQAMFGGKR